MFTVIRNYPGAPSLADDLTMRSKDVEALLAPISGFVAYYLVKTSDGAVSITVCEDRAGCDESTRLAGDWLRENLPALKVAAPHVIAGNVALQFMGKKPATI